MKEKILALLTAKFINVPGVRKDGLAQLANSLHLTVTTEDEAKIMVEKLSNEQVIDYIKTFRSSVDSEVSNATKTYEDNLKVKYDFVEKGKNDPQPPTPPEPNNVAEIIKNSIMEATKPLLEKINQLEQKTVTDDRTERLNKILETCNDDLLKTKIQKDFTRMNFGTEEDFGDYLISTKSDIETANQRIIDTKLSNGNPLFPRSDGNGVSKTVQDIIDKRKQSN